MASKKEEKHLSDLIKRWEYMPKCLSPRLTSFQLQPWSPNQWSCGYSAEISIMRDTLLALVAATARLKKKNFRKPDKRP